MGLDATARRRWFGGIVLASAVAMLVCGETILRDRLKGNSLLAYWMVCFVLVMLAIIAAFQDLAALKNRSRQEHRALLDDTLKQIETEARNKGTKRKGNGS